MEFLTTISSAFLQGGLYMWLILCLQVVSIAIIVERALVLFKKRAPTEFKFSSEFESLIRKGDLKAVQAKLEKVSAKAHPLARAIGAGVTAAVNLGGKDEIQGKMDEVLLDENARLERRTGFLAMLANVGTLMGLLGTITGMIKSFAAVSYASPMEKATLLSAGIAEAMNTTAYGLIMAIPTIIMFAILANRSTILSDDLNQGALRIYNWLSYAYEPVPAKGVQREGSES
ncbi:MAG: MotA/TolQ/ExbB proton channel family protein [Bacteriovoracales bacterium]|nr:MotA/TolQ/ExbB proton channel family protein [Bacteriovoracales bacterium]